MATPLASILPQPETQFVDANGVPYAGGSVYTYVPLTLTPKNTWKDSQQLTLNTNPIILDSAGRCIMYGTGQYRIILKDSLANTIYDQLSQDIYGSLGALAFEGIGANLKDDGAGNLVSKITTSQTIAAASTTNLGSLTTDVVTVTGNTTITSFGSSANVANPFYIVTFTGAPLLTYNATSLQMPTAANIQASAGDTANLQYLGSGNWKILSYQPYNGYAMRAKNLSIIEQTISSSGTYTPTTGMTYCQVFVLGGGGGGGGTQASSAGSIGGGGGTGCYVEALFTAAAIGASQSITIGAGGAGGSVSNGGTGGTTTVGSLISAPGGQGGLLAPNGLASNTYIASGGAGGGGATGGYINASGSSGGIAVGTNNGVQGIGGTGASTRFGGGGIGGNGTAGNSGGFGAGGGGGGSIATAQMGGVGGSGLVVIVEFCVN